MSELKTESKSNWECVSRLIKDQKPIELGEATSDFFYNKPRKLLALLSYYKFAAKLIGKVNRVLDVKCGEGLGTYVLAKECGQTKGIDKSAEAIQSAASNFGDKNLKFEKEDFLRGSSSAGWDAIVGFDPISNLSDEERALFWGKLATSLSSQGMAMIGTPNRRMDSQCEADSLESEMRKHFKYVFLFAAHNEIIHVDCLASATYLIAIGSGKK